MAKISTMFAAISALSLTATASASETITYAYDALGQLVGVVADSGPTANATSIYTYDSVGNRVSVVVAKTDSTKLPIFTFYNGQHHFYTASYLEGQRAGQSSQGVQFNLLSNGGPGTLPLYRCYVGGVGGHFISAFSNCEGFAVEGLIGYAGSAPAAGLVPLYRFYKGGVSDHFVTTNYNEAVNGGYSYEGVLRYVLQVLEPWYLVS